jgi:hypothetical protein
MTSLSHIRRCPPWWAPGSWTLRRAWNHNRCRLLGLIPLILVAIAAVEELGQGHFIFASLHRLVMR